MKQRAINKMSVCLIALVYLFPAFGLGQTASSGIGAFEEHADVGSVLHPGSAAFDSTNSAYTLTASGENMWGTADAFHFVWRKYSGDVAIRADIEFPTKTGNPHKKAVLMIRQSLDADSAYVDAALHVEGLTSLQSRGEQGGATHEVGIASAAATQLRLEKRGAYFYMYWAKPGQDMHLGGGAMRLELKEPFYLGIGVCSHDKDAVETAVFKNVKIELPRAGKAKLHSTLETISVSSTDRRVVAVFNERVSAPEWTANGEALVFHKGKELERIPAAGGVIEKSTEAAKKNAHGERKSPDGQKAAFLSYEGKTPKDATLSMKTLSDQKVKQLATLQGGEGTLGEAAWSPDSKRLVFVSYQFLPE